MVAHYAAAVAAEQGAGTPTAPPGWRRCAQGPVFGDSAGGGWGCGPEPSGHTKPGCPAGGAHPSGSVTLPARRSTGGGPGCDDRQHPVHDGRRHNRTIKSAAACIHPVSINNRTFMVERTSSAVVAPHDRSSDEVSLEERIEPRDRLHRQRLGGLLHDTANAVQRASVPVVVVAISAPRRRFRHLTKVNIRAAQE